MRRPQAIGFALFCCLSGSTWLVDNHFPNSLPSLEQQALHYLVVALAALGFLLFRSRQVLSRKLPLFGLAAAAIFLIGLPAVLNEFASFVSTKSGVALFALVPLCIVIGSIAFSSSVTDTQPGHTLMMPALVGFAGALLLPSFQLPSTFRQGLLFAVVFGAVLCSAAGSLWMYTLLQDCAIVPAVAILCGANALFLGASALLSNPVLPQPSVLLVEFLRSLLLTLPQLVLFVWLLREFEPVRLASRFLFVPVLTVIEGLVFLHPPFDLRLGAAVLLMALGGIILLLGNASSDAETPPSLGLR